MCDYCPLPAGLSHGCVTICRREERPRRDSSQCNCIPSSEVPVECVLGAAEIAASNGQAGSDGTAVSATDWEQL